MQTAAAPLAGSRRGTWRRALRATPVVLLTIVLTWLMTRALELNTLALDLESRLRGPRADGGVVIVQITDDDYREYFKQQSPLDPTELGKIIDAIAAAKPRAIGVDIDTSDPVFTRLAATRDWPPIVWGHGLIDAASSEQPSAPDHDVHLCRRAIDRPSVDWLPGGARGRTYEQLLATPDASSQRSAAGVGLWHVNLDEDGLIRRYQRCRTARGAVVPSLPWALAAPAANVDCGSPANQRPRPIKFRRDENRWCFSAKQVRTYDWTNNSSLTGKIVLLGGSFAAARDEHATPLGMMLGVDILADAVETELMGGGAAPPEWLNLLIGILDGYLILWLFYRLSIPLALLSSVVATLAVVAVVGLFSPGSWLYLSMVCVVVAVYQLTDLASDYRAELIRRLVEPPSPDQPVPPAALVPVPGPAPAPAATATATAAPASTTAARLGLGLAILVVSVLVLGRRRHDRRPT